jgi:hypothetical protein
MDRTILAMRCRTIETLLERMNNETNLQKKTDLQFDLSRLVDKVLAATPRSAFSPEEYQILESNLEHIALAVFMELPEWARESLSNVKNLTMF